MTLKDLCLAVTVPMIWGFGFAGAKAAFDRFPPILLMGMGYAVAAGLLLCLARPPRSSLPRLFLLAAVAVTLQSGLVFSGLSGLSASTAVLVLQMEVPFAALLAWICLGEAMSPRQILGMVVAFVGIGLIAGEPELRSAGLPLFLVLAGGFAWAIGQILIKRSIMRLDGLRLTAGLSACAAPQLLAASWLTERGQLTAVADARWTDWAILLYLGIAVMGLSYCIWYRLLRRYPVNEVMPFALLFPATSVVAGVLLLGEALTPLVGIGGMIVVAGLAVMMIDRSAPRTRVRAVKIVASAPQGGPAP